jgi:iron complex outermembrane receptor protein
LYAPAGTRPGSEEDEGNSPHNQVRLQSHWDLARSWQFDLALRYVDSLVALDVPSYISMDVRLGWTPTENLELAVVGQNLLDSHHPEFGPQAYQMQSTEVERSVFAKATWRY